MNFTKTINIECNIVLKCCVSSRCVLVPIVRLLAAVPIDLKFINIWKLLISYTFCQHFIFFVDDIVNHMVEFIFDMAIKAFAFDAQFIWSSFAACESTLLEINGIFGMQKDKYDDLLIAHMHRPWALSPCSCYAIISLLCHFLFHFITAQKGEKRVSFCKWNINYHCMPISISEWRCLLMTVAVCIPCWIIHLKFIFLFNDILTGALFAAKCKWKSN